MQIQKSTLPTSAATLFKQNFKTNRNSIRTIDKYLLESSFETELIQNSQHDKFIGSKKFESSNNILNKTTQQTTYSQFPDFRGLLSSNGLSKVQSSQDFFEDNCTNKIHKLQKEIEEQKTIIALQEQLINKLMGRLQGHNSEQKSVNKITNQCKQKSSIDRMQHLVKVRQLLETCVQQL